MSQAPDAVRGRETTGQTQGEEGVLASLGIQPALFAFQLVNVSIVLVIVWFLILKPLSKRLEERKRMIDESLEHAKRTETALAMAERRARDIVDEAKVAGNKLVARAEEDAGAAAERVKKKARSDIELLINQAKRNMEIDREAMRAELRAETADLVLSALQKILPGKFDRKTDEGFVKDAVKGLKG